MPGFRAALSTPPFRLKTVRLIKDAGGRASAITADVSSPADAERLVATAVDWHGGQHIAFNNAGIIDAGPLAECACRSSAPTPRPRPPSAP